MGSTVASSVCDAITDLPSQVLRRAGRGASGADGSARGRERDDGWEAVVLG